MKKFIPHYRMKIKIYGKWGETQEEHIFELDYFKRDKNNQYFTDIIDDYWCIPWDFTSIFFERINEF